MASQSNIKKTRIISPQWHESKSGYSFDFNSDEWQLDGSITIRFKRLKALDKKTELGFKKALCRYAEELSANHAYNVFGRLNSYLNQTGETIVSVIGLTNFRASLDAENEHKLGGLKGFLLAWNEWGFDGVKSDVTEFLEELKLKGNIKGKAVKSACPYSGALTHNEMGALIEWAANAFIDKKLSLTQYAYFLFIVLTGRRPIQICALRGKDLIVREDQGGNDYVVNCPRAKQQGVGFRGEFTQLPINEDLYLVLRNQWEFSVKNVEKSIGGKLPLALKKEVPVFLEAGRAHILNNVQGFDNKLRATPDFLHLSQGSAASLLAEVARKNTARSERTGDFINFTARRFRYTKGTNLTRLGISGVALAAALDHTDTQNIGVYTENTEETAEQINEIMAPMLAPLAQAFAGKLIASERDAIRASDPHSRIRNNKANSVGNCGTHSFCASGYRACYTCSSFQAWTDGPHEEVLEKVLEERQRQEELGVSKHVIQASDRLLLAVQQVIQLCAEAKTKKQKALEV